MENKQTELQKLINEMDKEPWYVKLKKWIRLQIWIHKCLTRKYWDKKSKHYVFKKDVPSNQTSIDWLEESMSKHLTHEQQRQFDGLFQQAKDLHKEEIMDAFMYGKWDWYEFYNYGEPTKDPAEYYNNTFYRIHIDFDEMIKNGPKDCNIKIEDILNAPYINPMNNDYLKNNKLKV